MAKLPSETDLGERPTPTLPRRTPMVAEYHPQTGFEGAGAEQLAHSSREFEGAAHVVLQAKEQADTLAAEDAFNTLRQKQMGLIYGPNGVLNQKGSAAVNRDLPTEYGTQLRTSADELSNGLGNDNQKKMFARRAATAQLQLQETAYQHVARQSDVYANQVLEGTLDTESRVAAAGGDIATSSLRINAAIDRHAQRFGTPEQEVTALKMKAADTLWSSKIKGLMYSDPQAAKKLFDDPGVNAQIGAQNRIVIEHELHTVIRPIEAKSDAELAMTPQTTQVASTATEVGGEPTVQAVSNVAEGTAPAPSATPTNKRDLQAHLGEYITNAEKIAEQRHPGDAVYRDQVVSQVKGKIATIAAAFEGEQRQAHGVLLTALAGGPDGKASKPTTLDDLLSLPGARQAYSILDPSALLGINSRIEHNQIESMGRPIKTDPKVEKALFDRIHLPEDDPRKISSPNQLTSFFAKGINQSSYDWLRKELDMQMNAGGRSLSSSVQDARNTAHSMLRSSPMGSLRPDLAEEAAYRFRIDLAKKVDEYSNTPGKDPRTLLTPGSPDYALSPEKVGAYMPNSRGVVSQEARDKLPKIANDADFDKLPAGAAFIDPQGQMRQKSGTPGTTAAAAPVIAKAPAYMDYIKAKPRSSYVTIEVPPRSAAMSLNGKTFESKQAAADALKAFFEGTK